MDNTHHSNSLLFNAYNGMMIGSLIGSWGIGMDFTNNRYSSLSKRMNDFFLQTNISLSLPDEHKEFKKNHTQIFAKYIKQLSSQQSDLLPYVLLGASFTEYCVRKLFNDEEVSQMSWDTIQKVFKTDGIPKVDINELADKVEKTDGGISINSLHSAALSFVHKVISPLPEEDNTTFVAMSFSEPYDSRYPIFYRPLLEKFGLEAIRAWGGVGNEVYYDVMLTLIDKCGRILVELSEPNPNVMYEFGYAHARGKIVYPILESSLPHPLSNINGQVVGNYSVSDDGEWVEIAIENCGIAITLTNVVIEDRRSE